MEGILSLLLLLLILSFVWNAVSKDIDKIISCLCVIVCSTIFTVILIDYCHKDNPTALDVYQGKTTLKYITVDGIKVDSIVVFKKDVTNLNIY